MSDCDEAIWNVHGSFDLLDLLTFNPDLDLDGSFDGLIVFSEKNGLFSKHLLCTRHAWKILEVFRKRLIPNNENANAPSPIKKKSKLDFLTHSLHFPFSRRRSEWTRACVK